MGSTSAAKQVTPTQGGTLATVDGATVSVPAGAVTTDVLVQLTSQFAPGQPLPAGFQAVQSVALDAWTIGGEDVQQFTRPVTLRVPYTEEALTALGLSETSLEPMVFNGTSWAPVSPCAGCGVDTDNNVAVIVTNQVAEFAVAGTTAADPTLYRAYTPLIRH